jgi:hypothetical protein
VRGVDFETTQKIGASRTGQIRTQELLVPERIARKERALSIIEQRPRPKGKVLGFFEATGERGVLEAKELFRDPKVFIQEKIVGAIRTAKTLAATPFSPKARTEIKSQASEVATDFTKRGGLATLATDVILFKTGRAAVKGPSPVPVKATVPKQVKLTDFTPVDKTFKPIKGLEVRIQKAPKITPKKPSVIVSVARPKEVVGVVKSKVGGKTVIDVLEAPVKSVRPRPPLVKIESGLGKLNLAKLTQVPKQAKLRSPTKPVSPTKTRPGLGFSRGRLAGVTGLGIAGLSRQATSQIQISSPNLVRQTLPTQGARTGLGFSVTDITTPSITPKKKTGSILGSLALPALGAVGIGAFAASSIIPKPEKVPGGGKGIFTGVNLAGSGVFGSGGARSRKGKRKARRTPSFVVAAGIVKGSDVSKQGLLLGTELRGFGR